MSKKKKLAKLFLELAQPDKDGFSRWVDVEEFVDEYEKLKFNNGLTWARKGTKLAQKYDIKIKRGKRNKIIAIKLNGKKDDHFSQYIKSEIKKIIRAQKCVVLGTSNPEVDHKNGMKNEARVMQNEDQKLSDFQPLSKAANDAKRQYCKECKASGIRFDAKKLGYPMSYYFGVAEHHGEENACIGCYWYDPLEFKRHLTEKFS